MQVTLERRNVGGDRFECPRANGRVDVIGAELCR